MRYDPTYELTQAIKTALKDNVKYDNTGKTYQIIIGLKKQYPDYYIEVGYPTFLDNSTKDDFDAEGEITIKAVRQRLGQEGSTTEIEMSDVVSDINVILCKQSLTMSNFTFTVTPYITSFGTDERLDDNEYIIREKTITYAFNIARS